MNPKTKTVIAIGIFSLAGLISFFSSLGEWRLTLPLFIFYILFIFNSYFSIKLFFGIIPLHILAQDATDLLLFVLYIALAFSFKEPLLFSFLIVLFFLFGSLKYVLLLKIIKDHPRLLRRKIAANILAALLGLLTLGGILMGYRELSLWGLVIVFVLANVVIFHISPLYRLDKKL